MSKDTSRAMVVLSLLFVFGCAKAPIYVIDVPPRSEKKFADDSQICGRPTEELVVARGHSYILSKPTPLGWHDCMLARGWKQVVKTTTDPF